MAAKIETKRKLRFIRSISAPFPDRTAEERLARIADIASGKVELTDPENKVSPTLLERLEAGQASRSVRNAADKRPKKKDEDKEEGEREEKGGKDRKKRGGFNRSADVNA